MARRLNPTTLKPFVEVLEVGDPTGHLNLTLVPLRGDGVSGLDYLLAADAIQADVLVVTEVSEGGSVPELLAASSSDQMILLLDGEELVGAKQNRILNTSILLPPRAKTRIPVSCVEQGRWRHASAAFSAGSYSPSSLRARKSRDVGNSLRECERATSDQCAVWEEVGRVLERSAAESPTMALHDAAEQRRDSLDGYIAALPYPENARGVMVAIGGTFVAIDVFDRPETLRRIWHRLLSGYALDAVCQQSSTKAAFTANAASAVLEHVAEVPCEPCPSVGLGEDWRFESAGIVGQALVAERACVHLSAFPNRLPGPCEARGSHILPPSRRRSHRGQGDERVS